MRSYQRGLVGVRHCADRTLNTDMISIYSLHARDLASESDRCADCYQLVLPKRGHLESYSLSTSPYFYFIEHLEVINVHLASKSVIVLELVGTAKVDQAEH
jgi:hypothetical protein